MPRPSRFIGGRSRLVKGLSARITPSVAVWYNNLASLLEDRGKYAEAEPLYRRAFEILQSSFGPEHPKTLAAKSNYDALRRLIDKKKSRKPAR